MVLLFLEQRSTAVAVSVYSDVFSRFFSRFLFGFCFFDESVGCCSCSCRIVYICLSCWCWLARALCVWAYFTVHGASDQLQAAFRSRRSRHFSPVSLSSLMLQNAGFWKKKKNSSDPLKNNQTTTMKTRRKVNQVTLYSWPKNFCQSSFLLLKQAQENRSFCCIFFSAIPEFLGGRTRLDLPINLATQLLTSS